MKTFIYLVIVSVLISCNNKSESLLQEQSVLTNSAFFPGSKAPGFEAIQNGEDGGFIAGPGTGNSNDGGFISGPNDSPSGSGTSPSPDSSHSTSSSPTTDSNSATPTATFAAADSSTASSSTDSAPSGSVATISPSPSTGSGVDGGFLPGGTSGGGSDQGSVAPSTGSPSGSGSTVSSGASTGGSGSNDGSSSTPSSSTAGSISPSNPANDGSIVAGSSGSQPTPTPSSIAGNNAGTDGGSLPQPGTSHSGDGGSTPASTASPSGSSASGAGNTTASTASAAASQTTGSSQPSQQKSQLASAVQTLLQLIQNLFANNSKPASDGGSIGTSGGNKANDTGTVSGGSSGNSGNGNGGGDTGSSSDDKKVVICHLPFGNIVNEQTLSIGEAAAKAHIAHGDYLGECKLKSQAGDKLTVGLSRVCSSYRSTIAFPQFIFFEEAQHPRMTLEVASHCNCFCSCFVPAKKDKLPILASVDLSQVDMMEKRYSTDIYLDMRTFKEQNPKWRNYYVQTLVCDDSNNNGRCGDETGARILSINSPQFTLNRMPTSLNVDVWNARNFTRVGDPELCEKQYSPLVLDLGGDGFKLTAADKGVSFDLNASGQPISTAWVEGQDNAFLVMDRNGNGRIDDGSELFGSATVLKNGKRAANGFEALKELDSNKDGIFSCHDATFDDVRLWLDRNFNGITDRGELIRLEKANIKSINLDYKEIQEVDPHGNQTRQRSTFERKVKGQKYVLQIIDVWFNTLIGH